MKKEEIAARTKNVVNRMSRSVGHLSAVKRMIEDGRDWQEVLIQLSAVKAEIANTGKIIFKNYLEERVDEVLTDKEQEVINEVKTAIDMLLK